MFRKSEISPDTGVNWGRFLGFSIGPRSRSGVKKNCVKPDLICRVTFIFGRSSCLRGIYVIFEVKTLLIAVASMVAGISTRVGLLNLKTLRTCCQAKFLTSRHVRMQVLFHISNTLRKLIIRA